MSCPKSTQMPRRPTHHSSGPPSASAEFKRWATRIPFMPTLESVIVTRCLALRGLPSARRVVRLAVRAAGAARSGARCLARKARCRSPKPNTGRCASSSGALRSGWVWLFSSAGWRAVSGAEAETVVWFVIRCGGLVPEKHANAALPNPSFQRTAFGVR